jgi:hypothetical protein
MPGVQGLAQMIATAVQNAKQQSNTYYGQVAGSGVLVNGITYPYVAAIDTVIQDGDYVWCVLNDNRSLAVIIGK